jgi:hypothetical protein
MYEFLILGNLREIDLQKAKANQVTVYKSKLSLCASLQTSGSLLALVVLERKKKKKLMSVLLLSNKPRIY